jgi:hypothetical protein
MQQGYAMLDGAALGTDYDPSVDSGRVVCKNPKDLWLAFERSQEVTVIAKKTGKEIIARMDPSDNHDIPIKRTIFLDLKMDKNLRWHFNIRTNPASVFTGDNTFGSLLVVRQIKEVFNFVLDYFGDMGVNVQAMRAQVAKGHIVLSSISFAVYTQRVKKPEMLARLLNKWYFMYETRVEFDRKYMTLLDALGLSRSSGEQYEDSIGLNIFGYNLGSRIKNATERGHKLMHLCLYNKAAELRSKDNLAENDDNLVDDLEHRLRFDLTVSSYFFQTAWNMKQVTLRTLYQKMKQKGSWGNVVEDLMDYAVDRTCLEYMATAPNVHADEHSEMLKLWESQIEEKNGRALGKWDPRLVEWAEALNVNLKVSPTAHLLIHQGRLGLHMNRADKARLWLSGPEGAKEYAATTMKAAQLEQQHRNFARAVGLLRLDTFGSPNYLGESDE